jgi:hypothetical protein
MSTDYVRWIRIGVIDAAAFAADVDGILVTWHCAPGVAHRHECCRGTLPSALDRQIADFAKAIEINEFARQLAV